MKKLVLICCGELKGQQHITGLLKLLMEAGLPLHFISIASEPDAVAFMSSRLPGLSMTCIGITARGQDFGGLAGKVRKFLLFLQNGIRLLQILRRVNPGVLYIVNSWSCPYFLLASLNLWRWRKIPKVYHTFDMLVPGVDSKWQFLMEKRLARAAVLNVNVDRNRAPIAKTLLGLADTPMVLPLWYPRQTSFPDFDQEFRQQTLKRFFGRENGVLFFYPTTCSAGRCTEEIIRAFAELPEEYLLLTIEGGGAYFEKCRALLDSHHLAGRVAFMPRVTHEEILRYAAIADVGGIFHNVTQSLGNYFSHPSRLAYYVPLGLPVLATEVMNLEAVIYKYRLGRCCPVTAPGIAAGLRGMKESGFFESGERNRIRQLFATEFHLEIHAGSYLERMRQIMSEKL